VIAELPPGAYWECDVLVLDPPEHIDKRTEAPTGPFGDIDETKWANYANFSTLSDMIRLADVNGPLIGSPTAAQMAAPLDTDKPMTFETRVGGRTAHVGTLRKERLEEAIYQCLI
jgi:hypothetical protein